MPITAEHVGRRYPPTRPYRVSAAKIAEFAAALGGVAGGDPNPAYTGEHPIAPPTFAVVIASQAWDALFDDPDLGLALRRTIHADQKFTWRRPLRDGDTVLATLTIDSVRALGPADRVGVRVDLSTIEGEHLCTAASTLLHTRPQDDAA